MNQRADEDWVEARSNLRVEGVKARRANFVSKHRSPRHVHHEYVFSLAIAGATEIDCGHCNETHVLRPKDLLLTEAHEVYASRALGLPPWRSVAFSISKEKLGSLLDFDLDGKQTRLPHFTRGAVSDAKLRRRFIALYDSFDDDRTRLEQESLLLEWVVAVGRTYAEQSNRFESRRVYSESARIGRVREFIRANVGENIKPEILTEIAGLSQFHLNRAFKAQVGLPPHEFQNQLRIEKAQKLIRAKMPFAEIAFDLGFSDQSHFNRFFKRFTGVTPGKFIAR